jgi:cytochrome c553
MVLLLLLVLLLPAVPAVLLLLLLLLLLLPELQLTAPVVSAAADAATCALCHASEGDNKANIMTSRGLSRTTSPGCLPAAKAFTRTADSLRQVASSESSGSSQSVQLLLLLLLLLLNAPVLARASHKAATRYVTACRL